MSKRHALFVACSDATDDVWLAEIFLACAYGVYPLAVHEDAATDSIVFRRTGSVTEKDKAMRLQKAAEELSEFPEIEDYNKKNKPLFIQATTISVLWPMDTAIALETHVRIIPCLLRWTRMDRFDGLDDPVVVFLLFSFFIFVVACNKQANKEKTTVIDHGEHSIVKFNQHSYRHRRYRQCRAGQPAQPTSSNLSGIRLKRMVYPMTNA